MADSGQENLGKDTKSGEKSKSHIPDFNEGPSYRSEDWFTRVVDLPNWRIDMLKDINHVCNNNLFEIFGDKVAKKGYSYLSCKSKVIKKRLEQLYSAIF